MFKNYKNHLLFLSLLISLNELFATTEPQKQLTDEEILDQKIEDELIEPEYEVFTKIKKQLLKEKMRPVNSFKNVRKDENPTFNYETYNKTLREELERINSYKLSVKPNYRGRKNDCAWTSRSREKGQQSEKVEGQTCR